MKLFWFATPLSVLFGYVAILEVRSDAKLVQKIRNLVPVILGLAIVAISCGAAKLFPDPSSSYSGLAHWIAFSSTLVGSSGALVSYSKRFSSVLMALAGLTLAFLWIFFGQPTY
jgi:hypothetical protein